MSAFKKLLPVAASIILVLCSSPSYAGQDKNPSPFEIDKMEKMGAPDFTLKDVSGKPVTLSSLKGKVVLLNFWATWCPPCRDEMPVFNKLYREMKQRGLEVVAVSTDNSIDHVKDFLSNHRVDFKVLHDEDRSITKKYKVFSMPTTFLLDRKGVIVEKFFGEFDASDSEIRKTLERLLSAK